jgi:hypothetical protein
LEHPQIASHGHTDPNSSLYMRAPRGKSTPSGT